MDLIKMVMQQGLIHNNRQIRLHLRTESTMFKELCNWDIQQDSKYQIIGQV